MNAAEGVVKCHLGHGVGRASNIRIGQGGEWLAFTAGCGVPRKPDMPYPDTKFNFNNYPVVVNDHSVVVAHYMQYCTIHSL